MDPDMPNNGGPFNIFAPATRDNPVINDFTLDFIPGGGESGIKFSAQAREGKYSFGVAGAAGTGTYTHTYRRTLTDVRTRTHA